jgi:catechol 2,3-dioxygenase-like lactoylglutathione lyase family enzyme
LKGKKMKGSAKIRDSTNGRMTVSRRDILKAIPALAFAPNLLAQGNLSTVAVRKLHSFGLRVSDVAASTKFYQDLFGAPIQARQGDTVCLRIGEGPRFFSLSPTSEGEQPNISHIGLSVANFDLDTVRSQLAEHGISRSSPQALDRPPLNRAMLSWVTDRVADAGGAATGTEELFFADLEGLTYQLSSDDHCGGAGPTGTVCEHPETAPTEGLIQLLDISHFTNSMINRDRANGFYTTLFGKQYQAYQGPTSPIVGVGDGIQFLMYTGGSQAGRPTRPGSINHTCFGVANFDVDRILSLLTDYGLTARENPRDTAPLNHWISMRMSNRGGAEGGTPELYFSDPDGLRIQLQDASYCGGGGYLGDNCAPLA